MPRPLKVYRTPVGFHGAYIAVPTKKAAIDAWGASNDIFQRGEAEEVADSSLTAEPLAHPGVVIKRLRGASADHLAALGTVPSPAASRPKETPRTKAKPEKPLPKPKPRPCRARVEEAEAAVAAAKEAYRREIASLVEREDALARERREIETNQRENLARLEKDLEKAEARYDAAIRKWRR